MEYFKAILEVNHQFAEANNAMAQIFLKHNDNIGEAIRVAKIAVSLQPHRSNFRETFPVFLNI